MAGVFKNQAGKGTSTGKRAVFIPVIIGLLALLPVFNQTLIWFDLKISDFLFSAQPLLLQLTGASYDSQPPVLIINKDQTFFQRFGRDPDRADFASLLHLLTEEQTRVAGLDFIYDQPTTAEKDGELTAALASYPGHFWPRILPAAVPTLLKNCSSPTPAPAGRQCLCRCISRWHARQRQPA